MRIGLVWVQMELLFLVLRTITITITTTTIIVASLCLQTLTIQIAKAVGHVMLASSKSTICVFGGISFITPLKSSRFGSFLFAFWSFYLYCAGRSEYERSTCRNIRCVLSHT
jgi:hypothetical protein